MSGADRSARSCLNERGWGDGAQVYAETFALLCDELGDAVIDAADLGLLPAGSAVLDVGSGTGLVSARAVASGLRVVACEPDAGMLTIAGGNAPTALQVQAALPSLPFPDAAFAAVLVNFVINHVPDPVAAVRELHRVTEPGGRVVVTIWPSGQNTQARLWDAVIAEAEAVVPASTRLPEALDFERTPEGLVALMQVAGPGRVTAHRVCFEHRTYPGSLWDGAAAGIGGIGRIVTSQSEQVRERMRAAYERRVAELVVEGELVLPSEAILAVAVVD